MNLASLSIPAINRFASHYINKQTSVTGFFHYPLTNTEEFNQRVEDLKNREFHRQELATCIEEYMKWMPKSPKVQHSIEKLKMPNSTVVIGGQQAGLLTGPLYTIHKILSIIKLAEEQEKNLQIPVVPVFWIAGEDHDFQEVNHVFVEKNSRMEKSIYPERLVEKRMVSDILFNKDQMNQWIREVISYFGETDHTKKLIQLMDEAIQQTETMTELFSYIISELFKDSGLLLIDAAFPPLRRLEKPFFEQLITNNQLLNQKVLSQQADIKRTGFSPAIEFSDNAANLFIYHDHERILLEYDDSTKSFIGKNGEASWTQEEFMQLLERSPEKFSNNVVTRPLMQEWLFPTLAFIAGPGEIAYWAELKQAFEFFHMKMPPIVPRLNVTILERDKEKYIKEFQLEIENVLSEGVEREKQQYWETVKEEGLHDLVEQTATQLFYQYQEIQKRAEELDKGLLPIIEKNLKIHHHQLEYLKQKTDQLIEKQHEVVLNRYDQVNCSLRPNNGPQERVWNVFYFLNQYGLDFIDELLQFSYPFDGSHQLIRI
ncbi:bacillithiol biosynthesis cysteine-adding enzyme BshC [Oikeobacillus pervagus]|uniref:Putative cysteine ligase BshC n=1 Tax=Oikeobacillus pervagus TaxID=1325931 RepID=A0AAJ1T139_9BACI|nr:bacillithiol biosynthesis cysteine-adding enzyme BshC [Oikeobacillus pervagus]MDQ0215232.1 bacillithiol biosynthesis cysteine-adding enzyme BshC [Oikeobacillus pervagus]